MATAYLLASFLTLQLQRDQTCYLLLEVPLHLHLSTGVAVLKRALSQRCRTHLQPQGQGCTQLADVQPFWLRLYRSDIICCSPD